MSSELRDENFGPAEAESDRALLKRFVDQQDRDAFAEMVARHGPTVWGVCRRFLGSRQDVEDAFQATFLVLVRQADNVREQSSLKSWLIGVAKKVSMRALRSRYRRWRFLNRLTEHRSRSLVTLADNEGEIWEAVRVELAGLSQVQRNVIERCVLGDQTYREASEELGIPLATLASHVRRGRAALRERLAARGIGLTAVVGVAAAVLPSHVCGATVAQAGLLLAGQEVEIQVRVLTLAKGAVSSMSLTSKCAVVAALTIGIAAIAWIRGYGLSPSAELNQAPLASESLIAPHPRGEGYDASATALPSRCTSQDCKSCHKPSLSPAEPPKLALLFEHRLGGNALSWQE